ncbi:MAG: hypothetical protein WCC92_06260 [Candidatus Korobacteraceae bacterium]
MKGVLAIGIMALFALVASPAVASATSTAHHGQAITGCLENGGSAGHYKLMEQNGTAWKVKDGEYVHLAPYVGETVTVAGPEATRHGDRVTVLDVVVDSQSCHQ